MNVILTLKHSQITFTFFSFRCNLLVKKTLKFWGFSLFAVPVSAFSALSVRARAGRRGICAKIALEPLSRHGSEWARRHNAQSGRGHACYISRVGSIGASVDTIKDRNKLQKVDYLSRCIMYQLLTFWGLFECFSMFFGLFGTFRGAFWMFFNAFLGFLGLFGGFLSVFQCFFGLFGTF